MVKCARHGTHLSVVLGKQLLKLKQLRHLGLRLLRLRGTCRHVSSCRHLPCPSLSLVTLGVWYEQSGAQLCLCLRWRMQGCIGP